MTPRDLSLLAAVALLLGNVGCAGNSTPAGNLSVAVGPDTAAVVDSLGQVWGWGRLNTYVGGLPTEDSVTPQQIDGLRDGEELCFGASHALLRVLGGGIVVWSLDELDDPYVVQSLASARALACGAYAMVAIDDAGTAWILSAAGTSNAVDARIAIEGLPPVVSGDCGDSHCAFIDENDALWTWGENDRGQLGTGTTTARSEPYQTPLTSGVERVSVGGAHTVALANGQTWGWGANESGQLAQTVLDDVLAPLRLESVAGVTEVAAGRAHSLFLFSDRNVAAVGANDRGQLGNSVISGDPVTFPAYVIDADDGRDVRAAGDFSLAITARGFLAWGDNGHAQLGTAGFTETGIPQLIGPVPAE